MVKTRIAPSPTGDPHLGTAYTALFNFAFARKNGGKFVLRIEDTDQTRLVAGAEEKILKSLKWLGLFWDQGPYRQSERLEKYKQAAEELVKKGDAYYCDCSLQRLTKLREEQQAKKQVPRYDKKCRLDQPKNLKKGSFVVRLKVPERGQTTVEDLVRGTIVFKNEDIDDSVLLKSDGWPTYHLAAVVDDQDMGISHIIRAEEWLPSTPKHIILYQAFGFPIPKYLHLPLLRNRDKSKISKRKNPVSIDWYKDEGFLPEALLNYLALMGWSMPDGREKFNIEEFIKNFDASRIDPAGPIFDLQKLAWLNGEWIRSLPNKELQDRLKPYTKRSADEIKKVLPLVYERMKKLSDFDQLTDYFFEDVDATSSVIIQKGKDPASTALALQNALKALVSLKTWDKASIEKSLSPYPEKIGWSKTDFFQTIRATVSGSLATPPLHETLEALGKEKTVPRIEKAVKKLME